MLKLSTALTAIATVAALAVVVASSAKADLVIEYNLGGGFTSLADTASGGLNDLDNQNLGSFHLTQISDTSNSPGTSSISQLLSSSLDITNTSGSTATIIFAFSDTGFTSPTAPPSLLMNSHIGGSVVINNTNNLLSFTSCANQGSSNLTSCAGATAIAGPGTPNVTANSFDNDQFDTVTSLTSPYSLNQILSVTLGAGSELNFSDNTTLTPVPEPNTLAIFGTMLVAIGGIGYAVRRRRENDL